MIYPDSIVSFENKHIKQIKKIINSPKSFPEFLIVEGEKHASEFKNSSYFRLVRWFIVDGKQHDFNWIDGKDITVISQKILQYLSDVESSQGIIGLFSCGYSLLNQNYIDSQETFILDEISDPGNLGALIRTAVALERKHIILVGGVFPFSSKVVRASAGMIAHIKITRFTLKQMAELLFNTEIKLLKMDMKAQALSFQMIPELKKYFILLGNEGNGIKSAFEIFITKNISLPMADKAESLNVSAAGSVAGYLMWGKL